MFIEPVFNIRGAESYGGWIEVICGCMFSGKTEELLRRVNRALYANQKVVIFNHRIDERYNTGHVVSHNKNSIESKMVKNADEIMKLSMDYDVIGIDEVQFFDKKIVKVCTQLANSGKRVIVAGLDMDSNGEPFGSMPYLLAVSEFVTKLHAICEQTGELASFTYRKSEEKGKIMVGASDKYEARSRRSFYEEKSIE